MPPLRLPCGIILAARKANSVGLLWRKPVGNRTPTHDPGKGYELEPIFYTLREAQIVIESWRRHSLARMHLERRDHATSDLRGFPEARRVPI
jgi:hypothetical protein